MPLIYILDISFVDAVVRTPKLQMKTDQEGAISNIADGTGYAAYVDSGEPFVVSVEDIVENK